MYEKRKSGALQIEAIVRDLLRVGTVSGNVSTAGGNLSTAGGNLSTVYDSSGGSKNGNGSHSRIEDLILVLTNDFTYSVVPNSRNGGLIGLV